MSEIADNIEADTVLAQVFAHAERNQDVLHLCWRCKRSLLGAFFRAHYDAHALDDSTINQMMAL